MMGVMVVHPLWNMNVKLMNSQRLPVLYLAQVCQRTYPGHGEDQVSGGLGPLSRRAVGLHFSRQDDLKYLQSKLFITLISEINALIWQRCRPPLCQMV